MIAASERAKTQLTPRELAALAAYGATTTWPDGLRIYERGAPADGIFLVGSGTVALRTTKRRRGFVPALVFPGETFGGEGLIPGATYVTDSHATEPSETLHITGVQFRALLREQPACASTLIAQLAWERAALLHRIQEVCAASVEERVIAVLVRFCDRPGATTSDHLVLDAALSRLLCEVVGATRESITHALSRLVMAGVVVRDDSSLVVSRSKLLDEWRRGAFLDREVAPAMAVERSAR